MRGSIVGTRRDLDEALAFAAEGKVKAEIDRAPLDDINAIFARLKGGKIDGRVVLDFTIASGATERKAEAVPA